ncbi:potassium channel family protein [Algoriphagus sanaruensis]|uniref:Transporter n=1 Tax=Algoriphagus sanaruensis TaxID=1727163 RepID=A0A142EPW9_9BACT|nr:potassium channel family protein [Algoriphagus sanaruensis]AMQ57174.1 transporter [Algoriphagus sanaruensis]
MPYSFRVKRIIKHFNDYWLNDISFLLLLVVLVFTAFVLPVLIEYGHIDMVYVNLVFIFLFFTGIWSSNNQGLILITSSLFLTQIVLRILRFSDLPYEFYLLERIFGLINMAVFIFMNIRLLFRNNEVNLYRVIGAVNVYLLLAILGAFAFELIQLTIGSSIVTTEINPKDQLLTGSDEDFSIYIYFSLVSLTTVGFGDYVPINILSKMVSVFLSTVGILYPAVVIAKLVGYSSHR